MYKEIIVHSHQKLNFKNVCYYVALVISMHLAHIVFTLLLDYMLPPKFFCVKYKRRKVIRFNKHFSFLFFSCTRRCYLNNLFLPSLVT